MNYYRSLILLFFLIQMVSELYAQPFSRRDSLQGGLSGVRVCYDVLHYNLDIKVNPDTKFISGNNRIHFKMITDSKRIQLDLFENMKIDSIKLVSEGNSLITYSREFDAVFIDFKEILKKDKEYHIDFYYSGSPLIAKNAPWDGGFVWKKDQNNKPFIGVAVQGTGASLWYPCKDSQSDEPDLGAIISLTVPSDLVGVSNGRLIDQVKIDEFWKKWVWQVNSPINNYNITINVADYVSFSDVLNDLDISYYVLRSNFEIAQKHFNRDVKPMLQCFESKFGKYPFAQDGFKLVETPYLGMEHQSAIAYGNNYKKGYLGFDTSRTGIGLNFDYIIIHETAHEWFGNSVTSKDIADFWIHESFTTYAESIFVECLFGKEKALEYVNGYQYLVANLKPMMGQFGVNYKTKNSDVYYKGALMLNTLRSVIDNDDLWFELLYAYSEKFKHQIIERKDVVDFFNSYANKNFTSIFNQYLDYAKKPVLEIKLEDKKLSYRWISDEESFDMPIKINLKGKEIKIEPNSSYQYLNGIFSKDDIKIDKNLYYIDVSYT